MVIFAETGCHCDLHSFPTRRSSDLHRIRADRSAGLAQPVPGLRRDPPAGKAAGAAPAAAAELAARSHHRAPAPGSGEDRKSTRLNSSHVEISYAVFFLKKKTTLIVA